MKTAADIARLVRDPDTSFQLAVEMIQMFADRQANAAAVRATECTGRSLAAVMGLIMDAPLQRKVPTDA